MSGSSKEGINLGKEKDKRILQAVSMRSKKRMEETKRRRLNEPGEAVRGDLTVAAIPALHQQLHGVVQEEVLGGLQGLRILLCPPDNAPTNVAQHIKAEAGCIEKVCSFLSSDNEDMVVEAAWVVTNLIADDEGCTRDFMDSGVIPHLLGLIAQGTPKVSTQALWAIGNVCGEHFNFRNAVIGMNFMDLLLAKIGQYSTLRQLRVAVWVAVTIVKEKPSPPIEVVQPLLPVMADVLLKQTDEEVLINAGFALAYLTDMSTQMSTLAFHYAIVPRLIKLCTSENEKLSRAVLRTLGNMLSTDDQKLTDDVINMGLLPPLHVVLTSSHSAALRKEVLWLLSNIAAGSQHNIASLIRYMFIPSVVSCLERGNNLAKREAMWVVRNILSGGNCTHKDVLYLAECGIVGPLSSVIIGAGEMVCNREGYRILSNKKNQENVCLALETVSVLLDQGAQIAQEQGGNVCFVWYLKLQGKINKTKHIAPNR